MLYPKYGKRICDVTLALILLVLAAPVMAALTVAIWMKLGRPALFRQKRCGLNGAEFTLCKFRTMTDARDENGELLPDEDRLPPFGNLLRSTSLDELPSLLNVLKGEMSIAGPRPLSASYLDRYSPEQARRHEVKPGLTGWLQVNGRNLTDWEEKFRLDVWYVDHMSFWLDLRIMFLTPWKVIRREGVSAEGHATMPEFIGNKNETASASKE